MPAATQSAPGQPAPYQARPASAPPPPPPPGGNGPDGGAGGGWPPSWLPFFGKKKTPPTGDATRWIKEHLPKAETSPRTSAYLYSSGFFGIPDGADEKAVEARMTDALNLTTLSRACHPASRAAMPEATQQSLNQLGGLIQEVLKSGHLSPDKQGVLQRQFERLRTLIQQPVEADAAKQALGEAGNVWKRSLNKLSFGLLFKQANEKQAAANLSELAAAQEMRWTIGTVGQLLEIGTPEAVNEACIELFGIGLDGKMPEQTVYRGGKLLSACYLLEHPESFIPLVRGHGKLIEQAGTLPPQDMFNRSGLLQNWEGKPLNEAQAAQAVASSILLKSIDRIDQMARALEALPLDPDDAAFQPALERLQMTAIKSGKGIRVASGEQPLLQPTNTARATLATLIGEATRPDIDPVARREALTQLKTHGSALARAGHEAAFAAVQEISVSHSIPQLKVVAERQAALAKAHYPDLTFKTEPGQLAVQQQRLLEAAHQLQATVAPALAAARQTTTTPAPEPTLSAATAPASAVSDVPAAPTAPPVADSPLVNVAAGETPAAEQGTRAEPQAHSPTDGVIALAEEEAGKTEQQKENEGSKAA